MRRNARTCSTCGADGSTRPPALPPHTASTSRPGREASPKPADLTAAGVERLPRVVGARDGLPLVERDRVLEVANVIWCTGFHPGFSWLDLPVFDPQGDPQHEAGVVRQEPGLYFVGLHFLYAYSSTMIHGVGRDAERVARHIVRRTRVKELAAGAPAAA